MIPDIVSTLFSNYAEIHAAQLGFLGGLFVGLLYRERPVAGYGLLFAIVFVTFGDVADVGHVVIDRKPW